MTGTDEELGGLEPVGESADLDAVFDRAHEALVGARRLHDLDRDAEAAGAAALAAELFDQLGLGLTHARMQRLRADCLLGAGRPDEATEAITAAAARFGAIEDATPADLAGCEATLGAAARMRGDFDTAEVHLLAAAAAFDAADLRHRAAICRMDVAVVLHARGEIGAAVTLLTDVRGVLLEVRRADAVATCDFDLGVALHDLGELDDAVEYLQQARATLATLGRAADAAACNQNLGVALQAMGRPEEALPRLRDARAAFAKLGRHRDAAQCDHNLAVVVRSLGDEDDADRLEAQAVAAELAATDAGHG